MADDDIEDRKKALAKFLGVEEDEIDEERQDNAFSNGRAEYLVLTDEEADAQTAEYIKDSLWAFNTNFIMGWTNLPSEAEEMLKYWQEEKADDANETIKALITDLDGFIKDAMAADGRGHFLAGYDGEENEEGKYFIYRTN